MKRRYHIPSNIQWNTEPDSAERARLQGMVLDAIRRVIESSAKESSHIVTSDFESRENSQEFFSAIQHHSDRDTYSIPSYEEGGELTEVPVEESLSEGALSEVSGGDIEQVPWTAEQITAHTVSTFGSYGPRGQTYYGVQTPGGIFIITGSAGDQPEIAKFQLQVFSTDVRGHWRSTGTNLFFPSGRYIYRVIGTAEEENPPARNVARVTDLEGNLYGEQYRLYAPFDIGFQIVFDVPHKPQIGGPETTGVPGGVGIFPGGISLIRLRCDPLWDTRPLTDPAYAGMSDDDLWRLFLNLCNARAVLNLRLSEKYIKEELVPRYTGPNGAVNVLNDLIVHNIEYFQEDLHLLHGLMVALNQLSHEIENIEAELNPMTTKRYRATKKIGFFTPPSVIDITYPTYQPPSEQDAPRVAKLLEQLEQKDEKFRTTMAAILKLVMEEPLLTRFIEGFIVGDRVADVPDRAAIEAELADVENVADFQGMMLEELDGILQSIARAQTLLCSDPERVLDVPLVYEKVLEDLHGINQRFEEVALERIKQHHKLEAWTDIGLAAGYLVLFVGGLVVSLASGPAGVVIFLQAFGTGLSCIYAVRSIDKASVLSTLANVSVERGKGLVTLEAAREAQFWAVVDSIMFGIDVAFLAGSIARARKLSAMKRLSEAAEEFSESVEIGRRLDFEQLVKRAAPRGKLPLSEVELQRLQSLVKSEAWNAVGALTEELVERAILEGEDYLLLASKFRGNQGIDLVFVSRKTFEKVFGKVKDVNEMRRILTQAPPEKIQKLASLLKTDDLVSIEVKFSRVGFSPEELLGAARRGVQQNQVWYKNLLSAMQKATDPEVLSTARLLEEVIGSDAQYLERLLRVGISVDPSGTFKITRLTDDLIDFAHASKKLWRSRRYWGMGNALIEAERTGNTARAKKLRELLRIMNRQIDQLDGLVRNIKQTQTLTQKAQQGLQKAAGALMDVEVALRAPYTPARTMALHTANALARTYLEFVDSNIKEADASIERGNQIIQTDKEFRSAIEGLDKQIEMGKISDPELLVMFNALKNKYPELFER